MIQMFIFCNGVSCTRCSIADNQGLGTIGNDDLPEISINDVTLLEGNSGKTYFVFAVTRSSSIGTSSVFFATAPGTASTPSDYASVLPVKNNFNSGQTTKTASVIVNVDKIKELDETFFVNLSSCSGCTIADSQGVGTIKNDD